MDHGKPQRPQRSLCFEEDPFLEPLCKKILPPHSLMIHSRLKFREEWVDKMIRKPTDCHPWAAMEGDKRTPPEAFL